MGNVFEVKSHQPRVRLVLEIQYTGKLYPSAFLTPEPSTGHTLNSQSSHLYTVSSACYTYSYKGTIEAVVYKAPTPPLCLLPSDLHGSLRMWLYVIALPLRTMIQRHHFSKASSMCIYSYAHMPTCFHRDYNSSKKSQCSQRSDNLFISSLDEFRRPRGPRKVDLQCE